MLGELSSAGMAWLAIDMAGPGGSGSLVLSPGDARVIDIADPDAVPAAVNPLEPAPGYPIQAHADWLAGLFEAAFGLEVPVATAIRAGLRRTYAACGWDTRTGTAAPGAVTAPVVPAFRQLRTGILAATGELGYSQSMQTGVRGFLSTRLDALWAGPAGRFLEGGHPVDVPRLLRGNVLVTNSGVADRDTVSFLAGVLLVRLAEQLRPRGGGVRAQGRNSRGGPLLTVVIGSAGRLNELPAGSSARRQAAGWFGRLLEDIASCGADVIVARPAATEGSTGPRPAGPGRGGIGSRSGHRAEAAAAPEERAVAAGLPPVLLGRRSPACGERCRRRPCNGYELHAAALLAHDDELAWLRLWAQTMVLAFLTSRSMPRVPVMLRSGWRALSPRRRECVLATVIDVAVTARATALRQSYDPRCLASVIVAVAARRLDAATPGERFPLRAGHVWVVPQLRWLYEIERIDPLGQDEIRLDDIAPPLDFGLAGLPDWPGIRVRDRLSGLRRHPLSMESERNRGPATVALLGDDGRGGFDADLAVTGIGLSPLQRLRHAAAMMDVGGIGREPGWLEVVLSWPQRMIRPAWNSGVRRTATG